MKKPNSPSPFFAIFRHWPPPSNVIAKQLPMTAIVIKVVLDSRSSVKWIDVIMRNIRLF